MDDALGKGGLHAIPMAGSALVRKDGGWVRKRGLVSVFGERPLASLVARGFDLSLDKTMHQVEVACKARKGLIKGNINLRKKLFT